MSKAAEAYKALKEKFHLMTAQGYGSSFLTRDAETVMPPGSGETRDEQIVAVDFARHMIIADPRTEDLLNDAEAGQNVLPAEDRRNLQLMRRYWIHNGSLPPDLVKEWSRLASLGQRLHGEARKTGDWKKVEPHMTLMFARAMERISNKKERLGTASSYEAATDEFIPDIKVATMDALFAPLEKNLPGVIQKALEKQRSGPKIIPLIGPFPREKQAELNRRIAAAGGFDFNRGRLDDVGGGHPSCHGAPDDVRASYRCDINDFTFSAYAVSHEAPGHGLYEQNLPKSWRYQPAGMALGMAIHESQSRIVEVQAGLTHEYIGWLSEQAIDVFGYQPALEADNLYRLMLQVQEESYIRIAADELTYPMHVILRFNMERAIFEGNMTVADIPDAFNDGMKKGLGIVPPNHTLGCMQDIHWMVGLIGYFPSYALGDMFAADGFVTADKQHPELRRNLSRGDATLLNQWRCANVHEKGSLLTTAELLLQAIGTPDLSGERHLDHLSRRYLGEPFPASV